MDRQKNRLMVLFASLSFVLSVFFHILNRIFNAMPVMHGHYPTETSLFNSEVLYQMSLNLMLLLPLLPLIAAIVLHVKQPEHSYIPALNTVTLTLSSVSLIAGGGGMVELHFSIFMVVAVIAYYERINSLY